MYVFYGFTAIVIWLGVLSLRGGWRFRSYVRQELQRHGKDFTPFASVIVPCRGLEQQLQENLEALCNQDYPAYELLFVIDSENDAAKSVILQVAKNSESPSLISKQIINAGPAVTSGQKVHNLKVASRKTSSQSEILVFADSDSRPHASWLRSLVEPLHDEGLGASTGYRWFAPLKGGVGSHLCSVWNASIASALRDREKSNFCWGGATAIRRSTFESLGVREKWGATISDDFSMTHVLKEASLPIHFVPACLTLSWQDYTLGELLEFTTRQLRITRIYAANLWLSVLVGSLLFCAIFFGGTLLVAIRALLGLPIALPLTLLALIFSLGAAKGVVRLRAVNLVLAGSNRMMKMSWLSHFLLWPFASLLFLYNAIVASFSRRIEWRGITYQLKSGGEAVIIERK